MSSSFPLVALGVPPILEFLTSLILCKPSVYSHSCCEFMYAIAMSWHSSLPSLGSFISSVIRLRYSLNLGWGSRYSCSNYSWVLSSLFSSFTIPHCNKKFLWSRLRAAKGYRDININILKAVWQCNHLENIINRISCRVYDFLSHRFWLHASGMDYPCIERLQIQSREQLVMSLNTLANITPMDTSCLYYINGHILPGISVVQCWIRPTVVFSFSSLHSNFELYRKPASREREFPGQFKLISLSHKQVYDTFRNGVLPSSCGGWPRTMTIACIVLGDSGGFTDLFLVLRF